MTTSWPRSDRRALGAILVFVFLLPNAIASAAPEPRTGAARGPSVLALVPSSLYSYEILLDTDSNVATGGSITLAQAGETIVMQGVDRRVVVTADVALHRVIQTAVLEWNGATFVQTSLDSTQYPISTTPAAVEFGALRSALGNPTGPITARFHASLSSGRANDYTSSFTFNAADGSTVVAAIPTLGPWGFVVLASILALIGAVLVRNGRAIALVLAVTAILLTAATVWAATIIMDGNLSDWAGISAIVTDPSGDSSIGDPNEDITAGYVTADASSLYFRMDLVGGSSPTPTPTATPTSTPTATPTATPTGGGGLVTLDAVPDQTIPTNTTLSLRLSGHSTDALSALTYGLVAGPAGASVSPLGVFAFAPTQGQLGPKSVTARVHDGGGHSAQATFQVTVVDHDHAPVLGSLTDDTTRVGASYTKVLTATDPDIGEVLTFSLLSGPAGMTLTGSTLSWTPTAAQLGSWPIQVKVTDLAGLSASGQFHVAIQFLVATDDAYSVNLGKTLTVNAPGVLGNDLDPLAGPLSASKLTNPDKGTLNSFNADGSFTYQAPTVLPGPAFQPVLKWNNAAQYWTGEVNPVVADVFSNGHPVVFTSRWTSEGGITAIDGATGTTLWAIDGSLPAPNIGCFLQAYSIDGIAVGDIDDGGVPAVVMAAKCFADYSPYGSVTARMVALEARTGAVKWLTAPLGAPLYMGGYFNMTQQIVPAIARLHPGETPSVLFKQMGSGLLDNPAANPATLPACDQFQTNSGLYECTGVLALNGVDGTIRQRFIAPLDGLGVAANAFNQHAHVMVADLSGRGSGSPNVVANGAVWDAYGNLVSNRLGVGTYSLALAKLDDSGQISIISQELGLVVARHADGTVQWQSPIYGGGNTDVPGNLSVADLDGDGSPEIMTTLEGYLFVYDAKGQIKWIHHYADAGGNRTIDQFKRSAAFDLDGDGIAEVIVPTTQGLEFTDGVTGKTKAIVSWPDLGVTNTGYLGGYASGQHVSALVADIDGSGHASVVVTIPTYVYGGSHYVVAVSAKNNDWRPAPTVFNEYSYHAGNVEGVGHVPPIEANNFATPRTNVFGNQPQTLVPVDPRLKSQTSFTYTASDGPLTSAPGTVRIDLLPTNRPPVFTSIAPTEYLPFALSYAAHAVDPDPGDSVSYSILLTSGNGAASCSIDATAGLLSCPSLNAGDQFVVLVATDTQAAAAYQTLTLHQSAGPATVPSVVGQTQAAAGAMLTGAGFGTGSITTIEDLAPAGQVIQQTPGGGTSALLGSLVALVVSKGPTVPPPPGPPPGLGNIKRIVVSPASTLHIVGENVPYKATSINNDGTGDDITAFVVWSSTSAAVATVNTGGVAHAAGPGTTLLTATAGGLSGQASLSVVARANGDNTPPVAIVTQPASGGTVTGLTQILGTATDAHFLRYELALEASGDTTFNLIGQGTTQVTNGLLGTLDPTLLLNGAYTLRLTVFDANGNTAKAEVPIVTERATKVGLFTLGFIDLTVPLSGIPIQITRSYDSRDKRIGDFGVGWNLGIRAMRVSASGVQGTGWQVVQQSLSYSLVAGTDHFVSVTLPGGKVEAFDLAITPASSALVPFTTLQASYVPRPGVLGTLQSLDNTHLLITDPQPGPITLVDDTTLNTFDPDNFLYTAVDGTQFVVSRSKGVGSVKETNGNQITIGPGGISHSSGAGVSFARDASGRITAITDPDGHTRTYAYSATGDLASSTDAVGKTSTYFYNAEHGLIRMVDPAGTPMVRSEYDDSGRLISVTDAAGHTTTYSHDLSGRQDQVTDSFGRVTLYNYDERGNVLAKTDPLGRIRTFTYDGRDNQLTETDPLGRVATKTYDSQNNVLASSDFEGNTTTFTYDSRGHVLTTVDPEGRTTTSSYDAGGNLGSVTNPEGGVTAFAYDGGGNRLTITDPLGHVNSSTYDVFGHKLSDTDPLGKTTTYTNDASGHVLGTTDPAGKTDQRLYDAAGRLTTATDKVGGTATFSYSPVGDGRKVASSTDALGRTTQYGYDAIGNLVKTTYPDGTAESTTYDADFRPLTATNRDGQTTAVQYDAVGQNIQTTFPDGSTTVTTYDAAGRLLTQTNERGKTTTMAYASNQQTVTDALGNATVHRLDSRKRRVQTTDALGHVTAFAYDSAAIIRTTFPDGTFKTTTYDAAKRKTAETDQAGHTTQFAYDAAGQLIGVTDAAGGITSYTYDAVGNRLTQTDANGHTTQMTYDALGRVASRTRPSGKQESFVYDAIGNQVNHKDFNGQTTVFVYDAMNRLVQKNLPGGSTVAYAWSGAGLRMQAGGDSYFYDPRGRLLHENKALGETLTYSYDAAGNRTTVVTPHGTTTYTYDDLSRLATAVDAAGTTTYGYDAIGNQASMAYPNGVTATYSYDTLNRLVKVTNSGPGGLISSYAYTLGPAGNRVQVVEAGPATTGRTVNYTFDPVYRLTQERIAQSPDPVATIAYSYDAVGNRTLMDRSGVLTTYTYDTSDRLQAEASSAGTITSTYDDNGNVTVRGNGSSNTLYAYDAENRLVGVTNPGGAVTYVYDADGMRTSSTAGGTTTAFLVDKGRPPTSCGCKTDTGQSLPQVLAETAGANVVTYTYGHALIHQTRTGGGTSFYLTDGQLSTRQLTDGAAAVTDTYTFDAFGVTLASTGSTPNVYLFTGEQLDPNSGFYYLRARYYNQASGRFLTTDPEEGDIFDPVSLHRYLYANANPVDNRDPSGRLSLMDITWTNAIYASLSAGFLTTVGTRATGIAKDWSTALSYGAVATTATFMVSAGVIYGGIAAGEQAIATGGRALLRQFVQLVRVGGQAEMAAARELLLKFTLTTFPTAWGARCVFLESFAALIPGLVAVGKTLPAVGTMQSEFFLNQSYADSLLLSAETQVRALALQLGCP